MQSHRMIGSFAQSANRFLRWKEIPSQNFSTEKSQNRGMFFKPQKLPSAYHTCHAFHR